MPHSGIQSSRIPNLKSASQAPFREIIDRFGLLLKRQAEVRARLSPADLTGLVVDEETFLGGEPLIGFVEAERLGSVFQQSALDVWPVLGVIFPSLSVGLDSLLERMRLDDSWNLLCVQAVAHGQPEALEQVAITAGVSPDFLLMALQAAYAPCVGAHTSILTALAPVELWRRPFCPVCGSDPDMAMLEIHPEASEFLISKSGELWHHCPVCTQRWRFVRMVCPGCGNQNHESLTRFSLPDAPREYIYACNQCAQYLPCLDLTETSGAVDYDMAALHLVHLDAAAQSKGFAPLSPAPWTALGFEQKQAQAS